MSEYIKRDDVLKEVEAYIKRAAEHWDNSGYYEAQFEGFEELQDDLFNLPTINIIRCGECEHFNSMTHGCKRNPSVEPWWEDDFCSYGERIDNE